ncbi:conserved hypothetical protein, membrane or secreted [human gut metagenome]|uniref:Thioredoxin n=1 Tax=human gut metagenome TaxID=408170 RepID=K1U7G7_9ZZZZ
MSHGKKAAAQITLLLAGAAMLCFGVWRGEAATVLSKAIKLCLECVGIGKKFSGVSQTTSRFRGWIQASATLLTNLHLPNFLKGGLYQGAGKPSACRG